MALLRLAMLIIALTLHVMVHPVSSAAAKPDDGYFHIALGYQYLTAPTEHGQAIRAPVRLVTDLRGPLSEWLVVLDEEEDGYVISNAYSGLYLSYDLAIPYAYLRLQSEPALWRFRKTEEKGNMRVDALVVEILTAERYEGQHLVVGRHPVNELPGYVGLSRPPHPDTSKGHRFTWKLKRLG